MVPYMQNQQNSAPLFTPVILPKIGFKKFCAHLSYVEIHNDFNGIKTDCMING